MHPGDAFGAPDASVMPLPKKIVTAHKSLADYASTPLQLSKTVENYPESVVLPVKYEQLQKINFLYNSQSIIQI